jgi:tripartite-type tricarboxylate transporter receptor subunit TctC
MPTAVVTQLNNAMAQVLAMSDLRDKLSAEAVELTPMTPAQFGDYMKKDLARWTKLAHDRNINLDNT